MGLEITHSLFPVRDTQWSRNQHPKGKYHILTSGPMADRSVYTLVLSKDEVAAELANGAKVVPTVPRWLYDLASGRKSPQL